MNRFVDMARTPAEMKEDDVGLSAAAPSHPLYPYGLCLRFTQEELDKLDLDDSVESGDMIHLHAMGKVTCVSTTDTDKGVCRNVEIQLTAIAVEDEGAENDEAEQAMPRKVKNPYEK